MQYTGGGYINKYLSIAFAILPGKAGGLASELPKLTPSFYTIACQPEANEVLRNHALVAATKVEDPGDAGISRIPRTSPGNKSSLLKVHKKVSIIIQSGQIIAEIFLR